MGRNYKKKVGGRTYRNYTEDQLNEALAQVVEGKMSLNKASKEFNIPFGTLHNKYNGKHGHTSGGQTALTSAEETAIINAVTTCSDWGYPLSLLDLRVFVKSYLDREGRNIVQFVNNMPGVDWGYSFLKRNKNALGQRMGSCITKKRAELSETSLEEYFTNLKTTIDGIPPSNIFNYDEMNVTDDPGKKKLLYRQGKKYPEPVMNHSKSATTIMVCGSASGTLLPSYIIYKSEHLWDTWTEDGPKGEPCCDAPCCSRGSRFNRTSHGWIDSVTFTDWFMQVFLPHARRLNGRKALIGDNLASHFTDEVIKRCEENDIAFVCLPPNSTHLCQPLDVSFFRPMKVAWRKVLTSWKAKHMKLCGIPKPEFPALVSSTLKMMDGDVKLLKKDIVNGFMATGVFPFCPDKVLQKLPGFSPGVHNVNDSLVEFLKVQRYGQTDKVQRKKRRLDVVPGVSVAAPSTSDTSTDDEDLPADVNSDAENDIVEEEVEEDYVQATAKELDVGKYVLVKVLSGVRKSVNFRYAAIIQEKKENEYEVLGLKSVDSSKTVFKGVDEDIFNVDFSDILAVLPEPKLERSGNRIWYRFKGKVDVKES